MINLIPQEELIIFKIKDLPQETWKYRFCFWEKFFESGIEITPAIKDCIVDYFVQYDDDPDVLKVIMYYTSTDIHKKIYDKMGEIKNGDLDVISAFCEGISFIPYFPKNRIQTIICLNKYCELDMIKEITDILDFLDIELSFSTGSKIWKLFKQHGIEQHETIKSLFRPFNFEFDLT